MLMQVCVVALLAFGVQIQRLVPVANRARIQFGQGKYLQHGAQVQPHQAVQVAQDSLLPANPDYSGHSTRRNRAAAILALLTVDSRALSD